DAQRKTWAELVGAPYALPRRGPGTPPAPEQRGRGQDQPRGDLPITGPFISNDPLLSVLLVDLGVQAELKMTDEQKANARAFAQQPLQAIIDGGRDARAGKAGDGGRRRGPPDAFDLPQGGGGFTSDQLDERTQTLTRAAWA